MKQSEQTGEAAIIPIHRHPLTDPEIVAGVLRGNPQAGHALVERYGGLIDRRVWRLMGVDSEHSDVVQQVFQQVVATLHRLTDPQALAAWVDTLTVNVVRKEFRRRKYRQLIGYSTPDVEAFIDDSISEPHREQHLLLRRAFDVLQQMPATERIVFSLRFIEGMPLQDVARVTGCSLATAKRRISRSHNIFTKKARRDPFLASLFDGDGAQ